MGEDGAGDARAQRGAVGDGPGGESNDTWITVLGHIRNVRSNLKPMADANSGANSSTEGNGDAWLRTLRARLRPMATGSRLTIDPHAAGKQ